MNVLVRSTQVDPSTKIQKDLPQRPKRKCLTFPTCKSVPHGRKPVAIGFLIFGVAILTFICYSMRRVMLLELIADLKQVEASALKNSLREHKELMNMSNIKHKSNVTLYDSHSPSVSDSGGSLETTETALPKDKESDKKVSFSHEESTLSSLHKVSISPAQTPPSTRQKAEKSIEIFSSPASNPQKSIETRVVIPKKDPFTFPEVHEGFNCPHTYLENVCYDVHEKNFVKHVNDSAQSPYMKFVTIPYRIGSEEDISPASGKRKTLSWMGDLTIYSQLMYKDKGAHFWLAIWPTIHYLDVARRLFKNKHIVLYTDQIILSRPTYEQQLWEDILLGLDIDPKTPDDVNPRFFNPQGNRTPDRDSPLLSIFHGSIPHISTDYVCFRNMFIAPWLPCKARLGNYDEAYRFKKRLIYVLPKYQPMYHCSESKDNLFHLLQRKARTRRFANIAELQKAIAQIADVPKNSVIIFDSDINHYIHTDVEMFSKITFLISAHGAGAMNIIFLPKESHFIEIFPPFFDHEHMYERVSKDIGLHYFPFFEKDRSVLDDIYPEYVGNPVPSTLAKKAAVKVTLDGHSQFRSVLKKAINSYRKVCRGD